MALITFMSDFGYSDHYVAAVKAKILSVNPGLRIVDITHGVEHFNIPHAAFVLKSVYKDFPKGTVHLVGVDSVNVKEEEYLAVKLDEHFFLGVNNGLLSLIADADPAAVIRINLPANHKTTFPAKDVFAPAAARLASGASVYDLGTPTSNFRRLLPKQVKATKKQMSGNVIRVDHYGNLITNLEKELFYSLKGTANYHVAFARERVYKLIDQYHQAEPGDCFALFNADGLLEIGISNGNAAQLLGMDYDSPVSIYFEQVIHDYFQMDNEEISETVIDENKEDVEPYFISDEQQGADYWDAEDSERP
jgi:S-adenosylmethionine hydrolase